MVARFYVRARWDAEAAAFVSDTNIPGLNVEAATLAAFLSAAEELAPLMLEANVPPDQRPHVAADGSPLLNRLELEIAA